jgi:SAM-dependent methyltransferase
MNMVKCPICGFVGTEFDPFGRPPRNNAQCPGCRSLERHRQLWLLLQERCLLKSKMKILHFAAEPCLVEQLRDKYGDDYFTADLDPNRPESDTVVDITAISHPSKTFDAVIANHVLEHVQDDRKAMREICRVLKKGGWAIITVPYHRDQAATVEKAEPDSADHVRVYGNDIIDRLKKSNFNVEVVEHHATMTKADKIMYQVGGETIFLCYRKK